MSSILERPFNARVPDAELSAQATRTLSAIPYLRFEHLATLAEVIGDLAASALGAMVSYVVYNLLGLGKEVLYPPSAVIAASMGFATLFVILLDGEGVYRQGSGMLRVRETEKTLRVSVLSFLLLSPITILFAHPISRWVLLIAFFSVPLLVIIEKQAMLSMMRMLHSRGRGVQRVIIYGGGFSGKRVHSALLRSRKLGLDPVAIVDDDDKVTGRALHVLGYNHRTSESVIAGPVTSQMIKDYRADMVIVAIPTICQEKLGALSSLTKEAGITLSFVPLQPPNEGAWTNYIDIDGIMLGVHSGPESKRVYQVLKRILDLVLSVTMTIVLSPGLLMVALLVLLDSEGPVIFKQLRVGKNGKLFEIYKFRTMKVDAQRYEFSPTLSDDQRITRIGRLLRKTSLDEFPQLMNVIKGEMSLVGPRPEMPFIVDKYGPRERHRLSVIPGITGLWQLSADRSYLIHENPHYDLYYIRHRGFFMDIAILMHTAFFAIRGV